MRTTTATLAALAAAALAPVQAAAAPLYNFINFDVPGSSSTFATGINNAGQVAGTYFSRSGDGLFLRDPATGGFTTLSIPGATSTTVIGIDNAGQVAGYYQDASPGFHGFLYNCSSNTYTSLNNSPLNYSVQSISESGDILEIPETGQGNEIVFDPMTGTYTTLEYPSSAGNGHGGGGNAINNAGQIAGVYDPYNNTSYIQGFLFDPANGAFTSLNGPYPTPTFTIADGINDNGQVVGYYDPHTPNGGLMGFVFDSVTGAYTTLSDPAVQGVTLASSINDAGQIVGSYSNSTGRHGFIATPIPTAVPEPASLALLAAALSALGLLRRRTAG